MNFNSAEDIVAKFETVTQHSNAWRGLFEAAYVYSQPNRNPYDNSEGARLGVQVYDTTLVKATRSFASKLQAYLTPIGKKWVNMESGPVVPDADKQNVDEQLSEIKDIIFKYLHQSNFDQSVNEAYGELALGTAALILNEGTDDDPFSFSSVQLSEFVPEEGVDGTLRNNYREWKDLSLDEIKAMWTDAKVTSNMEDRAANNNDATFDLLEADIYDDDAKEYHYTIIEREENTIIVSRTDKSSPWISFRWNNLAGETTYGRGAVLDALPAALTLNKVYDFELRIGALASAPPWIAYSDNVLNPYNLEIMPNSVIAVDQYAPGAEPIKPLQVGGNLQFSQIQIQDLRQQINDLMYTTPLPPLDNPGETATLTTYRMEQFAEEIGSAYGRLQVEFLNKLMERCVYILRKKGLVPNITLNNKLITLKYDSILSKTQDELDIASFVKFFNILQQIEGPQLALSGINATELPMWLGVKAGVDPKLLASPEQLQAQQQQLSQAMQAQAQLPGQAQAAPISTPPTSPQQNPAFNQARGEQAGGAPS